MDSREHGLGKRLTIALLVVSGLFAASPRLDTSVAQDAHANLERGVFGPLGEWIPFPPTPTWVPQEIVEPFPTATLPGGITATPSASPTPTSTAVQYITATPEIDASPTVQVGDPYETPPTRLPQEPDPGPTGPLPTPDASPTPVLAPSEEPKPEDPEVQLSTATPAVEVPAPQLPTSEFAVVTMTPRASEPTPSTPVAAVTLEPTPGGIAIDPPMIALLGPIIRQFKEKKPAEPITPIGDSGSTIDSLNGLDQGGPSLPGDGYMPSTVLGEMGEWTGAAVASVPIEVLPGPNGQKPNLTIGYSSNVVEDVYFQGGVGDPTEGWLKIQSSPFGYGWNLGGVPQITTVPDAPAFGDDDFGYELSVDGVHVRLIEPYVDPSRSGSSDKRTVYQTYPQAFLYVARTSKQLIGTTRCGYVDVIVEDRWEVITKDGTHYEFGESYNTDIDTSYCGTAAMWKKEDRNAVQFMVQTSTVQPSNWFLTRATDVYGNVMRYTYRREEADSPFGPDDYDAAITLKQITYGGPTEANHRERVTVVEQTTDRTDCLITMSSGHHWACSIDEPPNGQVGYRSRRLIDRIEVEVKDRFDDWVDVRVYNFDYLMHLRNNGAPMNPNNYYRALLEKITVSDMDLDLPGGSPKSMPPYTMTYDRDDTRINWLPLASLDNGLGGKTDYSYVSENVIVICFNEQGNRLKNHPRKPVSSRIINNNGLPVSKSDFDYDNDAGTATSGRCTEKFAHDIPGPYSDWYEFIGYGRVARLETDQKQTTSSGDDAPIEHITTYYNRCIEESVDCVIAGHWTPAEPHPNKGSVRYKMVRDQSPTGQLKLEMVQDYGVDSALAVNYIGLSVPVTPTTTWGRLDKVTNRTYGLQNGSGGTYSTVESVSAYVYEIDKQGNKQWGMPTRQQDFLRESDYPSTPYRTKRTWYATKESINGSNFGVTSSTFMTDRIMAQSLHDGPGGSSDAIREVVWNYYDNKTLHLDGVDLKGALTKQSRLNAVSSFVTTPSFLGCTGTVQRYLASDQKYTYTTHGNLQDSIAYADYGQVCIVDPGTASPTVLVDTWSPDFLRTTTLAYEDKINALVISEKKPWISGVRHETQWEYFGLNSTVVVTETEGYFVANLYREIDQNSVEAKLYTYDKLGRVMKVLLPGDTLSSPGYAFLYSDDDHYPAFPTMQAKWVKRESGATPWVNKGSFERTFIDGLGRVVQTHKAHYDWNGSTSPPSGNEVVSYSIFDAKGRATTVSNAYSKSAFTGTGTGCGGGGQPLCNPYVSPDSGKPKTTTTYDVVDRPLIVTQPDGKQVVHHYGVSTAESPYLWLDDVLDPNRHRKQARSDSFGRQKKVVEIKGDCSSTSLWGYSCGGSYTTNWVEDTTTQYVYDVGDRLTTMIEPLGNSTTISYDMFGRKGTMTDPDMGNWTYKYDAKGNLTEQVDARDQKICSFYDELDRLTQKRYFASTSTCSTSGGTAGPSYTYDSGSYAKGRRTGMSYTGGWHAWVYDSRGHIFREAQNLAGTGGGTYYTDLEYTYDDQLMLVDRPDTEENCYSFNPGGVDSMYDCNSPTSNYIIDTSYEPFGGINVREVGTNSSDKIKLDFDYDSNTNRGTWSKAGTSPSYDELQKFAYSYDDAGNIDQVSDYNLGPQNQNFTYDHIDRLASAQATSGGGSYSTETYSYDKRGNIANRAGLAYKYHSGKIHAVRKQYGAGSGSSTTVSVTAYTPGCTSSVYIDLYINGSYQGWTTIYAPTSLTTKSFSKLTTGDDVLDFVFSYGLNGTCTVHVDKFAVGGTTIQAEGGRVILDKGTWSSTSQDGEDVIRPAEALNDPVAGTTTVIVPTDGSLRFIRGSKAAAYEYDANGNVLWRIDEDPTDNRSRVFEFEWDEENRLKAVKRGGTTLESFLYDGDGKRIKAIRGTQHTFYVGDYYEYTEESSPYWHKADLVKYYLAEQGSPFGFRQGTAWPPTTLYWMLKDQVGSTSKTVLASTQSASSEIRYKPWGDKRYESGTTRTKKRYTGQREEVNTELYFYNARYYDPHLARFISPDTLVPNPGNPQDLNRYTYVRNNPISYNDPSGHCTNPAFVAEGCPNWVADPIYAGIALAVELTVSGTAYAPAVDGNPGDIADLESRIPWHRGAAIGLIDVFDVAVTADQCFNGDCSMLKITGAALPFVGGATLDNVAGIVTKAYREGGGHHILIKSAFKGVDGYNKYDALSIPAAELGRQLIDHRSISATQNSLYSAFARSGKTLTFDEMRRIEVRALTSGGIAKSTATGLVDAAINQLRGRGIDGPGRVPWGGR